MLIIGIAVAAPVGAMGVLLIQRTLTSGWRSGAATGLGIATADATYAAVAAFGITAISDLLVDFQTPLRLIGGVALGSLLSQRFWPLTARTDADPMAADNSAPGAHWCAAVSPPVMTVSPARTISPCSASRDTSQ